MNLIREEHVLTYNQNKTFVSDDMMPPNTQKFDCRCGCPSLKNIFAQTVKNLTLMKRNIG